MTPPKPSYRPTAKDVARAAGVSTATVSLVANNKADGRVTPETRERVRDAIEKLGYRVDAVARSLRTGTRLTVALVAPEKGLANPFYSLLVLGVHEALGDDYQVLMVWSGGQQHVRSRVDRVLSLGVDGVLVDAPSAQMVSELAPRTPVVLLDAPTGDAEEPRVVFDLDSGCRALTGHLLDLGHRRLAYLDGPKRSPTFAVRHELTMRLLSAGGAAVVDAGWVTSGIDIEGSARAFRACTRTWTRQGVSAVICATDVQAYGVLLAAAELGMGVPSDIAVASWDDLPYSQVTSPSLTSVALSPYDMGYVGANLLRQEIEQAGASPALVTLPALLHQRASTLGTRLTAGAVT
jgi:LacI family transcriptional regulator